MTLKPRLRRLVLTAHITFAVGWLGAVAAFLVLAIAGLTSQDPQVVQSVYISMDLIARYIILPLSFAPLLLTGPLLSLATPWGLFRHYWILVKLLINILSAFILVQHMRPIDALAVAAKTTGINANFRGMQNEMVIASGAALLALLVATALAVIKPQGMTFYGWRKRQEERAARTESGVVVGKDVATQASTD
jgi:membrane protein YdbS with pleckstrin-like domain